MKNRFCFIIGLASLLTAGCKDVLDEKPLSFISEENFYTSQADAIAAVNDAYAPLASFDYYNQAMYLVGDVASDQTSAGEGDINDRITLNNYTFDPANGTFLRLWRSMYAAINQANSVIVNVPNIGNMPAGLRDRVVGEAQFLRALHYFNLVRLFGGVPLLTEPTRNLDNLQVARTSADEVYELIIADLQSAETKLPPTYAAADAGRATQGAAKALLAKVYLTRGEWALARDKAKEVIDAKTYSLVPDYKNLWLVENENGPENIFSVQYLAGVSGSSYNAFFAPRTGIDGVRGNGVNKPERAFFNSYAPEDYRRQVSFVSEWKAPNGTVRKFDPVIFKYYDPNALSSGGDASNNYPVLRYADVLLMYAEAANEAEGGPSALAYQYLNQVRRRGFKVLTDDDPDNDDDFDLPADLGQAEFRDRVAQERNWELAFESHRWFDLVRTGKLIETMQAEGKAIQPHMTVFPIPQRELDINKLLVQNDGY